MNPGRRHDAGSRALGRLRDGTPYFAPLGEIAYDPDEDRVQCHLCGEWFRTIGGAHLIRRHGWSLSRYRDAFALLKGDPTCARGTSQKLREHTAARLRTGDLAPGTGYPKPLGSGGRGVRRSQLTGRATARAGAVASPRAERSPRSLSDRRSLGTAAVVAMRRVRPRLVCRAARAFERRRLPTLRATEAQRLQPPRQTRALAGGQAPGSGRGAPPVVERPARPGGPGSGLRPVGLVALPPVRA